MDNKKKFGFKFILILLGTALLFSLFLMLPNKREASQDKRKTSHETQSKFTNRLINEKSPYLLQHAHNPVDWYPWCQEAFEKARKEGKPIFLSVGYSTCHWCHVMEYESFSDPEVAELLNNNYVSIKVDREERPDIDDVYMTAVQLMTGSGGWPQTTILLPDGRPFFGGTYFPKANLMNLLTQIADAYKNKRPQVEQVATRALEAIRQSMAQKEKGEGMFSINLTQAAIAEAIATLRDNYDSVRGGFGGAPKFPPHSSFRLLFAEYERSKDKQVLEMAIHTLDAMALGGIHDHLGGGFHRYSTDENWLLPHFEKMLYDNAQLGWAYTEAYRITGNSVYKDVARDIYDWVLREMTDQKGGFYSALDADFEGEEGKYYVWKKKEILDLLGPQEGELFVHTYNFEDGGNFKEQATGKKTGENIPYLKAPLEQIAKQEGKKLDALKTKLLAARNNRIRPHLDDKVLTSWNGLMISSLAYAGAVLKEPEYLKAAQRAAEFAEKSLIRPDGTLVRRWREDEAGIPAFLEDYAYLVDGLLDLSEINGEKKWDELSRRLVDTMLAKFWDSEGGGFYETDGNEKLLIRPKNPYDNVTPSSNGIAARVLARLAKITGESRYSDKAQATFVTFQGTIERSPRAVQTLALAADNFLKGNTENQSLKESLLTLTDPLNKSPVRINVAASTNMVAPGKITQVKVSLIIEPGWHVNSHSPLTKELIPTRVTVGSSSIPVSLNSESFYPEGQRVTLGFSKEPLSVYQGTVSLMVPLFIAKDIKYGQGEISLRVHYQACNDTVCLAPETREVKVPIIISSVP